MVKSKNVNLVKALMMSRGFTIKDVAAQIGVGYHSLQKVIMRVPYVTGGGEIRIRENPEIREKLAAWFGYPYGLVWGPDSDYFLKKMIAEETRRRVEIDTAARLKKLGIEIPSKGPNQ